MLPKCPLQLGCGVRCETTGSVDISTDLLERGQQSSEDNSNVAPPPPPANAPPLLKLKKAGHQQKCVVTRTFCRHLGQGISQEHIHHSCDQLCSGTAEQFSSLFPLHGK